jgi:sulfoxide reductase heme-binding subunit YedZ
MTPPWPFITAASLCCSCVRDHLHCPHDPRLGGRTWRRLHRLAYATAALGVVHYWWLVKLDTRPPRNYGLVLAALLLVRLYVSLSGGAFRPRRGAAASTSPT